VQAGKWMEYKINVVNVGTYSITLRVANLSKGGRLQIESGTTVLTTVNIIPTKGWQTWTTLTTNVNLVHLSMETCK
jgi:hypothetical protein